MKLSFAAVELDNVLEGPSFVITPTDHWKKRHCLYDDWFELPKGLEDFYQLMESYYEYDGPAEEGRQKLLDAGLEEDLALGRFAS